METISPTRCVTCDEPGEFLCSACAGKLPFIDPHFACPRCGAPYGRRLCTECPLPGSEELLAHPDHVFPFAQARCALSFESGARRVIRAYKDEDELRLDAVIASLLCAVMRGHALSRDIEEAVAAFRDSRLGDHCHEEGQWDDWVQWADALAFVPASPEAVLRRDFDHMERIAKICARRTGLPLLEALTATKGAKDQRKLDRTQRLANRRASFALSTEHLRIPANVLLIDDVFTTGATLGAATELLLEAGAHEVRVVTCCRVW